MDIRERPSGQVPAAGSGAWFDLIEVGRMGSSLEDAADYPRPDGQSGRRPHTLVRVEIGAATHPGKVRTNNEDHSLVARMGRAMRVRATSLPRRPEEMRFADEEGYLMVVADGVGGAAAGEQAAAVAVATVEEFALN